MVDGIIILILQKRHQFDTFRKPIWKWNSISSWLSVPLDVTYVCIMWLWGRDHTSACAHTHTRHFWSMLLIKCQKNLCLGLCQHYHVLFNLFKSQKNCSLAFPTWIDGRSEGLFCDPSLLAGYKKGSLGPFPLLFLEAKGCVERGALDQTLMGCNWVLSLF